MKKKRSSRIIFGCLFLFVAGFIIATNDQDITLQFILFPIGMIITGLSYFFHGPMDQIPGNEKDVSIQDKIGGTLLFIGVACMISSVLLKYFGFGVSM